MPRLTPDESRALMFVALLLVLAAAARVVTRPEPVEWPDAAIDVDSLAGVARAKADVAAERARPLEPGERIDPNTASEIELDRLPGVGPAVARRIIAAREERPFRSAAELDRVRGIGPALVARIAPHVSLPATAATTGFAPAAAGAAKIVGPSPGARGPPAAAVVSGPTRIDVNRATVAELQTLPGIGPALARRIVAYRDSAGPFRRIEELENVRGIGPATVERLRSRVEIDS